MSVKARFRRLVVIALAAVSVVAVTACAEKSPERAASSGDRRR